LIEQGSPRHVRPNRARRVLRAGGAVMSPSIAAASLGDLETLELLAARGLIDLAWAEMEHGPHDWAALSDVARACDLWGITSAVRVIDNRAPEIGRALDRGIQSVFVPHVNTRVEAEAVVSAALYAPEGLRGMAFPRQSYGAPDYLREINDETLIGILLEDIVAFENLDELMAVERIDCFFIGPVDLAQTMGHLGQPFHPEVQAVVLDAIDRLVAAGHCVGTLVNDDNLDDMIARGVRFLRLQGLVYLERGLQGFKQRAEAALGAPLPALPATDRSMR
jgi:4-hydroxy-2-oxoheptanedioate aldolase